jgi:hypothetical protein
MAAGAYNLPMGSLRLFISHAHEDKPFADALKALIARVFPRGDTQPVRVDYSSDDAPGGGIQPGARWLEWIRNVVQQADVCIVILTEDSVSAPWLTWEAGAVSGVAMSTTSVGENTKRQATVIPVLFGLGIGEIPAPLQPQQAVNGEQTKQVLQLLFTLHELSKSSTPFDSEQASRPVARLSDKVHEILHTRLVARLARFRLPDRLTIYFVNSRYRLTLGTRDGKIGNGVRLECGPFRGDAHQEWLLYPVEAGIYKVVSASDKTQCISVEYDSKKAGATVLLWAYGHHESQHWLIERMGTGSSLATVRIVNKASNLCMEPTASQQIVLANVENYVDEDWWILTAPSLV